MLADILGFILVLGDLAIPVALVFFFGKMFGKFKKLPLWLIIVVAILAGARLLVYAIPQSTSL